MANPVIACPTCGTKNRLPVVAHGHPRCASCKTDLPWLVEAGDADFDAAVERSLVHGGVIVFAAILVIYFHMKFLRKKKAPAPAPATEEETV